MSRSNADYEWVKDPNTGKRVRVMKGADVELFVPPPHPKTIWQYTIPLRERVVELYSEGLSMRAIAQEITKHRPEPEKDAKSLAKAISNWMTNHHDFKRDMLNARQIRALVAEDKAIQAAEEADEDNVQSQRLKADVYKWAASVNNPEVYGNRTKVVGDPNAPIAFIIDTGVRREEDFVAVTHSQPQSQEGGE